MKDKNSFSYKVKAELAKNWQLYVLLILPVAYIITFSYIPMTGLQIAFKRFQLSQSMWDAPINPRGAFYQFVRFVEDHRFTLVLSNTIILSIYQLVISSIMPVVLALILNSLVSRRLKKAVQFVTYAPHFISTVVMVGLLYQIFSLRAGFVNNAVEFLGFERIQFMAMPEVFRHMYVWSGVWQETGYSSIIYLAALSSVDPQLHEAATVDGASKLKRIINIDIPGILPTFIILLIMHTGKVLDLGYTKTFLFQNPLNVDVTQNIDTFVYQIGLGASVPGGTGGGLPDYSYATAIGMFKSVIGLILITIVNKISSKVSETSLW